MPRGQPDFGAYQQKVVGGTLADMGELAVRLSSIVGYDRRGDVVDLDDFEDTILTWNTPATGIGYVRLDSTHSKSGSQAVQLHTDVGGVAQAEIAKYFSRFGVERLGVEFSFSEMPVGCDFLMGISRWNGVLGYRAVLWFDQTTTTLFIQGIPAVGWVPVVNFGFLRTGEQLWYPIKVVADFVNNLYVRVLFGDTEYDMSTIALPTYGDAGGNYTLAVFTLVNTVGANHDIWVDDFILTQNEP